jgi:glycosyltransferase involved in cell wall biosynthesis
LYYSVYRARLDLGPIEDLSVSVCVPCKNEEENIDDIVKRVPDMGKCTEIIFVDDKSTDRTAEKVQEHIEANPDRTIKLVEGPGEGKGAACRSGFSVAENDILMILDADMTTMPEELPDFFEAIATGKGEFINGSRLVYPMEKAAMRYLNIVGNRAFALLFSYLLSQRIKDTLCGTKVIWRSDYPKILESREYFGCSDTWGDYDWIFGAARHNLKIVELAVHYRERIAGETKMTKRFSNGWIMLKMCRIAFWRMKVL